jgi:hypothetical protein
MKIDAWAAEPGVDWDELYDPAINLGIISATDTFDLDDSINKLSLQGGDWVQITHTDGVTVTNYETIPANLLKKKVYGNYCAKIGRSLKFNKAFTSSDPEYGGTLTVPGYVYPTHLAKSNDKVPVPDPQWLVTISAAQYVQTDVTLAQNYPGLVNEANALMSAMKQANGSQEASIELETVARSTEW